MQILAIDTSCDDTAISLIDAKEGHFKILSNIVSSQVKLHTKYGGVYPSLAKREHQRNLPLVFHRATKKINVSKIDYIAVTVGPGLEPCLWQGINFAQKLTEDLKLQIIPVNHIEAHILANFIGQNSKFFPAVCLVVSGGHTQLILMKDIGKYQLIAETRDDAAGECFDKVARILGLGYPGGPAIAKLASQWKSKIQNPKSKIILPRPMIYTKDYDFSFSGLKTAVLYQVKSAKRKAKNQKYVKEMCYEVQQAIIDVLISKTLKAAKEFKVKSIIVGGGVAANEELRKQFQSKVKSLGFKVDFFVPEKIFCTDNAVMVAVTAFLNKKKIKKAGEIKAEANLKI